MRTRKQSKHGELVRGIKLGETVRIVLRCSLNNVEFYAQTEKKFDWQGVFEQEVTLGKYTDYLYHQAKDDQQRGDWKSVMQITDMLRKRDDSRWKELNQIVRQNTKVVFKITPVIGDLPVSAVIEINGRNQKLDSEGMVDAEQLGIYDIKANCTYMNEKWASEKKIECEHLGVYEVRIQMKRLADVPLEMMRQRLNSEQWVEAIRYADEALSFSPLNEEAIKARNVAKLNLSPRIKIVTLVNGKEVLAQIRYAKNGALFSMGGEIKAVSTLEMQKHISLVIHFWNKDLLYAGQFIMPFWEKGLREEVISLKTFDMKNIKFGKKQNVTLEMILIHDQSDYWIGKFEVTQEQFQVVMGDNPSFLKRKVASYKFAGNTVTKTLPKYPVECVSPNMATHFCSELMVLVKEQLPPGYVIALPTSTQWTHALEAKKESPSLNNTWMDKNSNGETHEVGSKNPTGVGLYDMYGNVSEICFDESLKDYILYGGNYYETSLSDCDSPFRYHKPDKRIGFRIVCCEEWNSSGFKP